MSVRRRRRPLLLLSSSVRLSTRAALAFLDCEHVKCSSGSSWPQRRRNEMRTSLEKGKQEDESERLGGETLKRRKKRAAAAPLLLPSPAFIIFSLPSSPALPLLFLFSFLAAEEETRVCSKSISQSSLSLSLSRTKKSLSLSLSLKKHKNKKITEPTRQLRKTIKPKNY